MSADALAALPEHGNLRTAWAGGAAIVTRVTDTGEPGYDVFVDRAQAAALRTALGAAGVVDADEATAEAIRIEAGVPRSTATWTRRRFRSRRASSRARSASRKGCYVGQEVIIRVLHRGHGRVARKLVGLLVDGAQVPPPGAVIRSGDREIGRVTSSTLSPALERPIALGVRAPRLSRAGDDGDGRGRGRRGDGAAVRATAGLKACTTGDDGTQACRVREILSVSRTCSPVRSRRSSLTVTSSA